MLLQFFIKESGEQKNETGVMEKHAYLRQDRPGQPQHESA